MRAWIDRTNDGLSGMPAVPTNSCCHVRSALSLVLLMIYAPATALARQGALGVILGISGASAARDVMPWLGLGLLDLARGADLDPPMRFGTAHARTGLMQCNKQYRHSITSSASNSAGFGMTRPRLLAVLRLINKPEFCPRTPWAWPDIHSLRRTLLAIDRNH
jgi:hypothetical protein